MVVWMIMTTKDMMLMIKMTIMKTMTTTMEILLMIKTTMRKTMIMMMGVMTVQSEIVQTMEQVQGTTKKEYAPSIESET